jgi:hypothetical protein
LPVPAPPRNARVIGTLTTRVVNSFKRGGSDGARTRDLRRDRPTNLSALTTAVQTNSPTRQTNFLGQVGTLFPKRTARAPPSIKRKRPGGLDLGAFEGVYGSIWLAKLRRQRDRAYQEQKRRERGARPQTQSLSQTRPWEAEKISRRTWERRRKNARVATSSAAILINADDEIASKPIKPTKRAASLRSAASALLGGISAQTRPALRAARLFAADGVNPGSVWRPASSAPTTGSARPPSPKADRWRREDADDDEAVLERYAAAANGGIR